MRLMPALLATVLLPVPAFAQDAAPTAPSPAPQPQATTAGEVVVTGRRRTDDVLGEVKILSGDDLAASVRPTIGETLAKIPGVTATGSGPNVSKPVLRGLAGDRIRVLIDGIGSLDVSASSSDHAVAINPLTADSIEVIHGPAALIYGSAAVGGVVDVRDSRIPRRQIDAPSVAGSVSYGTAADEVLAGGKIDIPLTGNLVAHVDAAYSRNDDLKTGGYILSRPLREEAAASDDPEIRSLADLKGELPNSDGKSFEAAGALAYVDGAFNVGASVSRRTSNYGVPIRYSLDPAVEAEAVHIDLEQTRYDARAEIPLEGFLKSIRLRGGYNDYQHREIAEDGEVGSQVFSKGGEARADFVQRDKDGWGGTSGLQLFDVKVRINGDEQYLPPSRSRDVALFSVQHLDRGPWRVEGGFRLERSRQTAQASDVVGNPDLRRDFTSLSYSGGASYAFAPSSKVSLSLSRSSRAPSVEELYANGPHAGNAVFEVGNPNLGQEKGIGGELHLHHHAGPITFDATVYRTRYSNFIYQAPTGEIEDDFPVYEYRQGRATYTGFEVQAEAGLGTVSGWKLGAEASADKTRATIRGFGPAPLIPPLRVIGALTAERGPVSTRLEVEHDWSHDRVAPLETATPGFTLINASVEWQPLRERPELTLGLAANNIFDVEARRSTSLLKDYAPLAGRDIRLTARFNY
ncbi:TonB-dependent receptor [Sphingomonas rhizophila]|uniref:TonB-dependent receptor n=1 Tax=Sphingomonas rhizophila TaxID=2071607 RepID=A0A7G9SC10_9SPHN|nr:TonB-dependent receptor [Sphingomonas rhizophila]QNN65385.1 TonB-dependent receptor [Sphingomonas rhizophila]